MPDILANGGGVVADYFEWVQNRAGLRLDRARSSRSACARFMTEAWHEVSRARSSEHDVRLRMAAHMLAVQRVGQGRPRCAGSTPSYCSKSLTSSPADIDTPSAAPASRKPYWKKMCTPIRAGLPPGIGSGTAAVPPALARTGRKLAPGSPG